ncbi:DUF1496 domain-containing protein [Pseudoduganella sp. LjRoot289]|uniref:DUF1496 domain-containing protein n=1 Tax=Pseudoduganella sp. LjRoot289 TaxID=3342314 RepID=UPI003ECE397E
MKSKTMAAVALALGIAAPGPNAGAAEQADKSVASAGTPSYCFYQDQKYSEGAVLNGRVCSRGKATVIVNGSRNDTRQAEFSWMQEERAELAGLQQELERTRMRTQLIHARSIQIEAEAKLNELSLKMGGKN